MFGQISAETAEPTSRRDGGPRQRVVEILSRVSFTDSDELRVFPDGLVNAMGAVGAFGLCMPREAGGVALDLRSAIDVIEATASFDVSIASAMVIHNFLALPLICNAADLPGRKAIVADASAGRALCAFALTEPVAGSAPRNIKATAQAQPDGYLLTGDKIWIGLGGHAEWIVCFAKTDDQPADFAAYLVSRDNPGLQIGKEHRTLGIRGIVQNSLHFARAPVSADYRLTPPRAGFTVAKNAMNFGRLGVAAMASGASRRAMQMAMMFTMQREIGSRRLIENGNVSKRIADAIGALDVIDDVLGVAISIGMRPESAGCLPLVAKVIATEWASEIADTALQFLGGRGYEEDLLVARIYRDLRITRIFEGPTETLLSHLSRQFSSRATSEQVRGVFVELGQVVELARLDKATRGLGPSQGTEVAKGWLIALHLAKACHSYSKSGQSLSKAVDLISAKVSGVLREVQKAKSAAENVGITEFDAFLADAGARFKSPKVDGDFMVVEGFE